MDNGLNQLVSYITQQLHQGVAEEQIRQSILQNNWDAGIVNQAFSLATNPHEGLSTPLAASSLPNDSQPQRHRVRNGVLWILSPFIVLAGVALINIIVRFAGISSPIINIFSLFTGVAGIILVLVGPIVGIIKLVSYK